MSNTYQSIYNSQNNHFHSVVKHYSVSERKSKLKQLKKWIKSNQELIIAELNKDFNKSREEIIITEIRPVITEINDAIENLRWWAESDKKKTPIALLGSKAEVRKAPKGVTLIIAPWNFPFMLCVGPMVSAIAAGCTAVLKPSENTPHCEALIVKMIKEIYPAEYVTTVTGAVEETTELLKLKWNHIFFTGSPAVGKIIMKAAAENLSSVTLELGGVNPAIIDKSAKLKDAAKKLIWGKFLNAGQSCISPNNVFVHQDIYSEFIEKLTDAYNNAFVEGNQPLPNIVNEQHFNRIKDLIETSKSEGNKVLKGGAYTSESNHISPTLLEIQNKESEILKEEIFGPVMNIISYNNLDDLIEEINQNENPLAYYLFSKSKKVIKKVINASHSGTFCLNDTTIQFTHPNLPFGGVNNSGIGKAHGEYGFKEFTHERAILKQRTGITSVQLIYPPYTKFKKWVINLITWWIN